MPVGMLASGMVALSVHAAGYLGMKPDSDRIAR
jgi:hypothetical protein